MPVDKFGRMSDTKTKDTGVSLTYINNNYVRSDGETPLTGSLDMRGNTLYNVADPVNPQDVVTKVYVDNTKGSGVIGRKTGNGVSIKENLDFLGKQKIKNLPDPVNDKDAVTKEYVDTTTAPFLKLDQTKYNTKGDIDMGGFNTVYNIKTPIDDSHIVDKKYVDEMDNLKSAFAFRNGEYYAKGNFYLRKNKLEGLREPLQDEEAANKKYVDDTTKNLFIDENDNIAFSRDVDMEGNKIFSLPEPEQDSEPTTKKYVDDLQNQYIDKRGNIRFGRNINLDNRRIFALKEPKRDNEGANKKYVDDTITKRIQEEKDTFLPQDPATKNYIDEAIRGLAGGDLLVSKEGVFIKANGHYRATAPLDIDNQKMENLLDPVDEKDAVNKKYVDGIVEDLTLKQGLVRENGGFNLVDSYINMNFNNIRNVGNPQDNADAVSKNFVDNMIGSLKETTDKKIVDAFTRLGKMLTDGLKKRKHIISASASYYGDLIKGNYQFTWNGKNEALYKKHDMFNGFLVPSSGYIKKFVVLDTGLKFNFPENKNVSEYIISDIGYNNLIPLFTFVLIRHKQEPVDIGTLYFYFVDNGIVDVIQTENSFKFNPNFEEETLCTVGAKDIINIRSDFNSVKLDGKRVISSDDNYNLDSVSEYYTYLVNVLIELDPLDD